ncbi:PAS domain-containing protein [Paenibacillus sp. IB182496]|uniref:histidine kinase n=1 Tax=Paenibacillus sabuli TaxID=2772509 RepID=A0A927BY92_9BACL|nr:histidine kinase N-terminal 7TM domain-containing protein [Paenibacillus sabuli]MBD2848572.1 PAS domain-containing protein [Paenibacillus sabuli]
MLIYTALVVSAIMMLAFFTYAFIYRRERGVRYFMWVVMCRVVFACSVILELSSDTLAAKVLYRNIHQSALTLIVPLMVLCVLDLLGKDKWLKPRWHLALLLVFGAQVALVWLNPQLGLVDNPPRLVDGYLELTKTPYGIAFNVACYTVLIVCVYYLIRHIARARPEIRKPGIWLVGLGTMSFLVAIVKFALPGLSPWLLPISVYTGVFGMAMLWIAFRNQLFSIVPMARNVVVETMQEGILIVDHRGKIIDSNPHLRPLFDPQLILGQHAPELLAPWSEWAAACRSMEAANLEIAAGTGADSRIYMVKVYPLLSQRQRKLGSVSVLVDITERQRRMEQIARLNQMKDQLFTVVSHDIRDPLAVQVNLIEVLEEDKHLYGPDNEEVIEALSEQIRGTYTMVENLLEWFRGQKEGIVLHPAPLELAELVREASRLLLVKSRAKRIELRLDVPERTAVMVDREAAVLILRNVLSNAIKYSRRGSGVQLKATLAGPVVTLEIRDQGVGMSAEQLTAVFDERRFESFPGTEGERGTGLGLFVTRQFLRLSGGRLRVESAPGEGSRFFIEFPAAPEHREAQTS